MADSKQKPAQGRSDAPRDAGGAGSEGAGQGGSGARILIVEDYPDTAQSLALLLSTLGHSPLAPVASGEEAVARATAAPPDLVLMDMNLAGAMDGITAAERILERIDVPIVFLSAYSDPPLLERAAAVAPYGYLVKPVAANALQAALTVALRKHRHDATARRQEQHLRLALDIGELGTWEWEPEGGWSLDARILAMLGRPQGMPAGLTDPLEHLVHPDDRGRRRQALRYHLEGRLPDHEDEYRLRHGEGRWVWVLDRSRVIERQADGRPTRISGTILEITGHKQAEQKLWKSAHTDPLTGAFNRRLFGAVLTAEIRRAERHGRPLSLLLFDLDRFKAVNDLQGHAAGDRVLRQVADTIRERLRKSDVLVRWGGEEFIVLVPETELDSAAVLAETLRGAVQGAECGVTASFGCVQYRGGESEQDWLARADACMYEAKRLGRNRVVVDRPAAGAGTGGSEGG